MRVKLLAATIFLVILAGCNDGDSDSAALTTSERRYCELVKFKARMPNVPKDAEPEIFTAQMSDSLQTNADYFNELIEAAPAEIKTDVEAAISALQRVAGGDITAYDGLDLTKADQWEEDNCNR